MKRKALTYAKVDLNNLRDNFNSIKALLNPGTQIMSVVKADGYGHSAHYIAKALDHVGSDAFGVANLNEALELRIKSAVSKDIYILSGADSQSFPEVIKHRMIPVIYDLTTLKQLNKEARKAKTRARVHLKFDTCMGRLGFHPESAKDILTEAVKLENIDIDGIMSHFSSADEEDQNYTRDQLSRFCEVLRIADELGLNPRYRHIANSAGIINAPKSHFNLVRPGIALYGGAPSKEMSGKLDLKPVMSLHSRILDIRTLPAGKSISYSRSFTTKRRSRIAVLPIGYADGYSRQFSNRARVMIHGKAAPVVGNVTMDMTMVDVTDIAEAKVGDYVTLLGESITAWELAEMSGTINYEIFTGISKRVERQVCDVTE